MPVSKYPPGVNIGLRVFIDHGMGVAIVEAAVQREAAYEAKRNLAAELLQAVREVKTGRTTRIVSTPVIEARKKTGLSQSRFALLMRVSVRTLQGWEQGCKQPTVGPITRC